MQLKTQDLKSHLAGRLAPIYLVSGDETLLVQEACDQIMGAARAQGFSEREVMHADRTFKWGELIQAAASMSLFAERRILDVRVPDAKIDKDASAILREYAQDPAPDNLLLIRCGRLAPKQRQSAWFKALNQAGAILLVWPVGINELPRWLQGRLREADLQLRPEALAYLVERVEGNLLAAVQEIAKLKLSQLPTPIDLPSLMSVLEDASHYDVFELVDAIFAGDGKRISRMLRGLQAEGIAIFAIMGALTSQLRGVASGGYAGPPQRQPLVDKFKRRHDSDAIWAALAEAALIDSQGKGVLLGDEWQFLERWCLALAGEGKAKRKVPPLVTLEGAKQHLRRL